MYKISVVVPTYNSEKSIQRCIKSIQHQKYNDLEIIVVNDGSTDNTIEIIDTLKRDDNRIKLIDIPNGGVSHARNIGIENATGDYITFVDSDDYIDEEMYITLMNIIQEKKVKIAHCSYKNVDNNENIISIVGGSNKVVIQNHDEAMKCLLSGRLFAGGMCNKLFSIDLFEYIRLNESIKYNEDVLVCFSLFDKVEESVYVDVPFYNYVAVESSSTHSANTVMLREQCLYVSRLMQQYSKGKPYFNIADSRVASQLLVLYRAYIFSKSNDFTDEKRKLKNEILDYKSRGFYNSKRDKISVFLFKYAPWMYRCIYKIHSLVGERKLDPEQ